ncbi:hypothetical protein SAMN00777080_2582 [Aquiflexum balticum DSM 16537]|uniref:Uncharacterized protein n=1 Tax=Aquiflexum balticum DSM 16537 TaxID=758820 RepID=A0A1W2H5S4_9BACT|nr:hypothetical protein [Aquiflexum balticum]SMD43968.1 hypothetical protein SAMN00777080_2582 [Aquiflexum balticum DSM 16537]
MKKFDDLKSIWAENQMNASDLAHAFGKKKINSLAVMKQQYIVSAIGLFGTTVFILWFGFLSGKNFKFEISYTALAILAVCLAINMLINLYNVLLISKLDDTLAPQEYLKHWLNFYKNRLRFFRLYAPILLITFCLSFALYVPEILGYYPNTYYKIGFILFIILTFFASYLMGKSATREEKIKLNELNNTFQLLSNG